MKLTLGAVGILSLARAVAAQEECASLTTKFPDCALPCVTSAAAEVGCDSTDLACRCIPSNSAAIQQTALNCVFSGCKGDPALLNSAIQAGSSVCGCVATATDKPSDTASETSAPASTDDGGDDETDSYPETTAPPTTTKPDDKPTSSCEAGSPCQKSADAVPKCATDCINSAAQTDAKCAAGDYECQCSSSSVIQNAAQGCVIDGCGAATGIQVLQSVSALCDCVEASPTTPCEATATSTESSGGGDDGGSETESSAMTTKPPTTTKPDDKPTSSCKAGSSPCQKSADAVPECATDCINSAAQTDAKCAAGDYECQCASSSVIQNAAQGCVIDGCGAATGIQVLQSVSALCDCVEASPTTACEATATPTKKPGGGDDGGDDGSDKPTTCAAATTSDCKPVASTAIPKCAQECFISAGPKVGCNSPDDYACRCEEEARSSLSSLLVPCVATACDSSLLPSIIAGSEEVCSCALAPPSGGDCSPTGGNGGGGGGSSKPTKTKEPSKPSEPTSCAAATTSDCGPIASSAIPDCAQPCFSSAAPSIGCDVDEFNCYCQDDARAQLSGLLVPCVATACDSNLLPSIIAGADSVCACATAPASGGDGDCGGNGGGGGGNPKPPKPTQAPGGGSGSGGSGSSCKPAEKSDCAPLTTLVPDCARPCFEDAGPEVGCDDPSDLACRCKPDTQASLSQILVPCVASRCDAAALPSVIAGASSVCACATAAPVAGDGDCSAEGGNGNGGGDSSPPEPTGGQGGSGGSGSGGSSCVAGEVTSADCAPLASSVVPDCAQECFSKAAPEVGCEVNSFGCMCQEDAQASLSAILVPCVASRCEAAQLTKVIAGASSVCECALAEPTGSSDTCEAGSGGGGSGGSGGGEGGSGGGSEGGDGGSGAQPTETGPAEIVPGSGARFEISLVAAVFGTFWMIAVLL